jgi:hypothetical protein
MKLKWYICTLILSLALLTVIQQQKCVMPNQEIVLQFQDETFSISDTKTTIANLKQKLQDIGVSSVEVVNSKKGVFRILYFSARNASSIKDQLVSENLIIFNDVALDSSSEKESKHYNFDVFEIKKATNSNWDFDGQLLYQLNLKSDRFSQTEYYTDSNVLVQTYWLSVFKTQLKSNSYITFISKSISYNVPEVRAGPLT